MAIKRLDPKAQFKVISAQDNALENETDEELNTGEVDAEGNPVLKVTRYEQYVENAALDESKLKFKAGMQPDRLVVRPLTQDEIADINSKHLIIDPAAKKILYADRPKFFRAMFLAAFLGIETDGKLEKVPAGEIPFNIQVEVGAVVSLLTSLDKNEKKR